MNHGSVGSVRCGLTGPSVRYNVVKSVSPDWTVPSSIDWSMSFIIPTHPPNMVRAVSFLQNHNRTFYFNILFFIYCQCSMAVWCQKPTTSYAFFQSFHFFHVLKNFYFVHACPDFDIIIVYSRQHFSDIKAFKSCGSVRGIIQMKSQLYDARMFVFVPGYILHS